MPGVPVFISEKHGIPVRAVTKGAPLMTVTNGRGIPIRISDKGVPFVVEGLEPPSATISITSGPGYDGSTYTSSRAGQWTADGAPIAGQTGATYTMTTANEGKIIRCGNSNGIQMWTPALFPSAARAGTWWEPDRQVDVTGGKATRLQNLFQTAAGGLDAVQADTTKQPVVGAYNGRQHLLNTTATNDAGLDATTALVMKTMVFWGRYKTGVEGTPGGRYPAFLGSRANGPNRVHGAQNSNILEVNVNFGNSTVWKNGANAPRDAGRADYFPNVLPFNNSVMVVETATGPSMMPTIGHGDPGGATQFDGEIGGVLYLPVSLSVTDRQSVEGYIRHRFGYSDLEPGHPNRTTAPMILYPAGGGPVYDPDAMALFARFATEPTAERKQLISDRFVAGKATTWWGKLDALWVHAAHGPEAGRLNWLGDRFNCLPVNEPAFTVDRGFMGDGVASYLDTQFNPTTAASPKFVQNSGTLVVRSNTDNTSNSSLAGYVEGANGTTINPRDLNSRMNCRINQGGVIAAPVDSSPTAIGMYAVTRNSATLSLAFRNGVRMAQNTQASIPPVNGSMRLGSVANGNNRACQFSMGCVGAGMTDAELLDIYNWFEPYRTALGVI